MTLICISHFCNQFAEEDRACCFYHFKCGVDIVWRSVLYVSSSRYHGLISLSYSVAFCCCQTYSPAMHHHRKTIKRTHPQYTTTEKQLNVPTRNTPPQKNNQTYSPAMHHHRNTIIRTHPQYTTTEKQSNVLTRTTPPQKNNQTYSPAIHHHRKTIKANQQTEIKQRPTTKRENHKPS